MWQKLKKPYFLNASFAYHLKHAFLFAFFVFLFLWVFKPFSIEQATQNIVLICSGFGAVTFLSMFIINIVIPLFFKRFFDEDKWTVGKEIFYTLINLFSIGIFNFLFFIFFFQINFSWAAIFWVQFITISVGIFPVIFSFIYKEKKNNLKYQKSAQNISQNIQHIISGKPATFITLKSKNQHEDLVLEIDHLIYLKAADNYIEVYFLDNSFQKKLIRNSLKEIEIETETFQNLFRCHKSYIVNLDKVIRISGNAQGYKLHFNDTSETIPVSRQFNNSIKEKLTPKANL